MEESEFGLGVPFSRCCICSDERSWADNLLVFCDGGPGCDVAVHQGCYGILKVPKGPWLCRKCESLDKPDTVRCMLCPLTDGAFKRTDNGGWAHVVCALYIPEVCFASTVTMEPILLGSVPRERYSKVCYICTEEGREGKGACLTCNASRCPKAFHATCAQVAGLLCEEAGNGDQELQYRGYCLNHLKQRQHSANDGKRNISSAFNRAKDRKIATARPRRSKDQCLTVAGPSSSSFDKCSENTMHFVSSVSSKKTVHTACKKEISKVKIPGKKKDPECHTSQKGQDRGGGTHKAGTKSKRVLSASLEEETITKKKPKVTKPKTYNQERPKPTKNSKKPASGQSASSASSIVASAKGDSLQECPTVARIKCSQNVGTRYLSLQKSTLKVPASKSSKSVRGANFKAFSPARSSWSRSLHSTSLQNSLPVLTPAMPSVKTENIGLQKHPTEVKDGHVQNTVLSSLGSGEDDHRGGGYSLVKDCELQASPTSQNDLIIGVDHPVSQRSSDGSPPMYLELSGKQPSKTLLGEVSSMEQLLERQWSQGYELLLEQANFVHVLEALQSLYQLKVESQMLEEQVRNLTREKQHLQLIKSQLSFPFLMPAANSTSSPQAPNALGLRSPCTESSLYRQNAPPLLVQDASSTRQIDKQSSAFSIFCCTPASNAKKNTASPVLTHSNHQLAMSDLLKALHGVNLTTDPVLPEPPSPFTNGVVPENGRPTQITSPQKMFSPTETSKMPHPGLSSLAFPPSGSLSVALPSKQSVASPHSPSSASPGALPSLLSATDTRSCLSSSPSALPSLLPARVPLSQPSDSQANSPPLLSSTDSQ